jgi:hypothetical protein
MQCPNCGSEVPAGPTCPRCGAALAGSSPISAPGPGSVPLAVGQKVHLLAGCLPVVTFTLLFAGYLVLAQRAIIPPPQPLFYLFMGVVLLILGFQAIQRLRDLMAGVALVEEDLLKQSFRTTRGPGGGRATGRFERLGTLRLTSKAYFKNPPDARYRVVYSPASRIVWALEPADARLPE